jgi:hypothetical protein
MAVMAGLDAVEIEEAMRGSALPKPRFKKQQLIAKNPKAE